MQAIVFNRYGPPDALQLQEVARPAPKANEILVKIHAAAANPLDWHRLRADPFLVRLGDGFLRPKDPRLGADIAGRVEAVGAEVAEFKPGDDVFGEIGAGGFAEYVCVTASQVAVKPPRLAFAAAAASPVVGYTALQGLRYRGQVQPGQKALINGASGGVGMFALQLAKALGAEVTGVCSTRNLELVRSIGADHVIDYTRADFTRSGQQYDLIYDAIGNRSVTDYERALTPQGRCVIAGFTTLSRLFEHMLLGPRRSRPGGKTIALMGTARPNKPDLLAIKSLLETGQVVPVIDRCYPLNETAEAIRYLETGRARGKVIVLVAPDGHV
jgi:NADPH:quinone reductase-like Zn-dependent oxidoreductase